MARIPTKEEVVRKLERDYTFYNEYEGAEGEITTYTVKWHCSLTHVIGSEKTQILVRHVGMGFEKRCGVSDCGITWLSLLRAWQMCASLSKALQEAWYEMDLQNGADSDIDVIPEQKLSTTTKETAS